MHKIRAVIHITLSISEIKKGAGTDMRDLYPR